MHALTNTEARWRNHFCRGKSNDYHTLSACAFYP